MKNYPWRLRRAGFFSFILLAHAHAPAKPLIHHGVFVYSNLCVEAHSGDTAGTRITLRSSAEGDSVLYEYTNGALSAPVLADDVKVDDRRKLVTFRVAPPGQTPELITGRLSRDDKVMTLQGDWCGKAKARIPLQLVVDSSLAMKQCAPCPGS